MDRLAEGIINGIVDGKRQIYNPTVLCGDAFEIDEIRA